MELKIRYQYTNFVYPYVIQGKSITGYLEKLLTNPKCKIRFFEKEKDYELYSYFLPVVREYLFWTFSFNSSKRKEFEALDNKMKAVILAKHPCTIFEYEVGNKMQGKLGEKNGIFFHIQKIEIICFSTGICFLTFKTNVEETSDFADVLNFNYKFRDIHSELTALKEYENINIQTDAFQDRKELQEFIYDICGENKSAKDLNIDVDRFLTYTYACLEPENWNEKNNFEEIRYPFLKYTHVLPNQYQTDFNVASMQRNYQELDSFKYLRIGFTKVGTALLTSAMDTNNYTKLPFAYENEYFYTYILLLYKKLYLKKLNLDFQTEKWIERPRQNFVSFTQEIWIQEITNDEFGSSMQKKWEDVLELENHYKEVKNKYDIVYKDSNVNKTSKTNIIVTIVLLLLLILNIIHFLGL